MQRIRVTAKQLGDRHYLISLSDRVAVVNQSLLRPGKGGRMARCKASYFGFATHSEAIAFANSVRGRFPRARLEVRQAKRLGTAFEVKVAHDCAEQLAWDFVLNQKTVSQAVAEHIEFYQPARHVDRSTAPISRQRPTRATVGRHTVCID